MTDSLVLIYQLPGLAVYFFLGHSFTFIFILLSTDVPNMILDNFNILIDTYCFAAELL